MKNIGVVSRGIKLPIVREGDDLRTLVTDALSAACEEGNFVLQDNDVVAITESIVARSQGNYCTVDDIAFDLSSKIGAEKHICVVHPILSRNRFAMILKGLARSAGKITLVFSFPRDEVGNALIDEHTMFAANVWPTDVLTLSDFRDKFGEIKHEFTGVDYVSYYKELIESEKCECEIVFSNLLADEIFDKPDIDAYIAADIHTREITKRTLSAHNKPVFGLDNLMTQPIFGSGFNDRYGLLGSNKAGEERLKLFPVKAQGLVEDIKKIILERFHVDVHVMVYGDGAFKDPRGKIWELADPVVSPFFTSGLVGTPNEIKIKFVADNDFKDLSGTELVNAVKDRIKNKSGSLVGSMVSEGTTPRQLTDLLGSLSDLTSGSGDKGTPVVLIQNYFNDYSVE